MQDRVAQAVQALKTAKSQGLSYYDAKQSLIKQGFAQDEIDRALTQFTYTEIDPVATSSQNQGPNLNQAFAQGVIHQEAIDIAKQQLASDRAGSFTGGRAGIFVLGKTLSDRAAVKELEQNGTLLPNQPEASNSIGTDAPSRSVLSQVPTLKVFVLYITAATTFQLLVLIVLHQVLLGSLIVLQFTAQSWVKTSLEIMAYMSQISVIINFALCLAFVLYKSFSRTLQLISITKLVVIFSLLVNLLTGNILNAAFGIFIYLYLNNVSDAVYLTQTGGT